MRRSLLRAGRALPRPPPATHSAAELRPFPSGELSASEPSSRRRCSTLAGVGRAALAAARASHCRVLRTTSPDSLADPFAVNCVADGYRKAGRLDDALHLLDGIPEPNSVSWNLRISIHNQRRRLGDSLQSFSLMHASGCRPTEVTYGIILSAAAMAGDVSFGAQIHGLTTKNGFSSNGYVATGLVDLFSKNHRLREAVELFIENPGSNVVVWNAVIAGAARNGEHHLALQLFLQKYREFSSPNEFTLSAVLTACAGAGDLQLGRAVHGRAIKSAADGDIVVCSAVVDLYSKCGDTGGAAAQFSHMPARNVVAWTTMISAYAEEDPRGAVATFRAMRSCAAAAQEINSFTLTSVLSACKSSAMAGEAAQIHGFVSKSGFSSDQLVVAALLNAYAKAGNLRLAEQLFEEDGGGRRTRSLTSWAAMISAFAGNSPGDEKCFSAVRRMLREGLKPDEICSCSAISATSSMDEGKQLHCVAIKAGSEVFLPVTSALFTMYSKCGSLEESWKLFRQMPERDGIAWTSMIAGLEQHGCSDEALHLLREMMATATAAELDQTTLSRVISACADQTKEKRRHLIRGKEAHARALRLGFAGAGGDEEVHAALISLYSKCGLPGGAAAVFAMSGEEKQQLAWSAMVAGHARNGLAAAAIAAYKEMAAAGLPPNHFAIAPAIGASAELAMEALGKQLHAHAAKAGGLCDLSVISALISMYASCGSVEDSRRAFETAAPPDVVAWTAMIEGYSRNGRGEEALRIYEEMRQAGTKPDALTFVSVLSACSRSGLVEEGLRHFRTMKEVFGVDPAEVHRTCVVDLLGRAGRLKEAREFIEGTAAAAAAEWAALLGACRVHGDAELGRVAAEKVLELEPDDDGAYVALSGLAADAGDWTAARKARGAMRLAGVRKEAGWSFLG